MPTDLCTQRPLFGGAVSSTFPLRFQDVSNMRQVPDHQEVFVDPSRDESLIFELLDLKTDVADHGSATWFLQDLANEQDAEGATVQLEFLISPPFSLLQLLSSFALLPWLIFCTPSCSPLSESAATVGAGLAVPAAQSRCMPMEEVFRGAISSFKVNDWSLFGAVA
ncbi:ran guanine nucleotide release factor-like [Salvia hispanica]|uniref:ran guanine nucleotide release factor-like n=1 Tax=Salvia hispanica TaxID=49212 RepID=UPI002009CF45|nr:ran guanine nucleotide release factor-like [Salvia hispanica]